MEASQQQHATNLYTTVTLITAETTAATKTLETEGESATVGKSATVGRPAKSGTLEQRLEFRARSKDLVKLFPVS
jgi:hypothetical protein